MNIRTFALSLLAVTGLAASSASGALVISQFYEGASFNKYIEITNTSTASVNITGYTLTLWSNAATENWKANGNTPNSNADLATLLGSSTFAGAGTFVIGHPSHAIFTADATSGTVNFNGDDSVVLYSSTTYDTTNILDSISFTDAGSEGSNTSVTRIALGAGHDLTAGSTFEDFPAIWSEIGQAAADGATAGTDDFVGFSSLAGSVPEPTTSLLGGIALLGLLIRRRG